MIVEVIIIIKRWNKIKRRNIKNVKLRLKIRNKLRVRVRVRVRYSKRSSPSKRAVVS